MAKESLSVKIAPVLKHPRYFWSRGLQRDITCQPLEFLSVSLHLSRSFIDAGVRDYPDVGLDHSQNWLVLVGKVRFAGGSSLNTVHVCHTVGRSLNGINRVPLPFPRFLRFFLIELLLVLTEEILQWIFLIYKLRSESFFELWTESFLWIWISKDLTIQIEFWIREWFPSYRKIAAIFIVISLVEILVKNVYFDTS